MNGPERNYANLSLAEEQHLRGEMEARISYDGNIDDMSSDEYARKDAHIVLALLDERAQLRKLLYGGEGYGAEDIIAMTEMGTTFMSWRGDPCWDTPEVRKRVREKFLIMEEQIRALTRQIEMAK